ncbi:hypothetical protein ATANTOWER_023334 [Ataeniobius toweri]|uniref:Uncharacterized protein n=1 Tax=Ataeniobius toweri TaxID=208326 RepID=A0ABU7BNZ5_9TELE|nr:hypothetical protein [Ataeniobius toweri]
MNSPYSKSLQPFGNMVEKEDYHHGCAVNISAADAITSIWTNIFKEYFNTLLKLCHKELGNLQSQTGSKQCVTKTADYPVVSKFQSSDPSCHP